MRKFLFLLLSSFVWAESWLEITPGSVEFGTLEAGKLSKPVKIQVRNVSEKEVVLGSVNVTGRNFLDFRIGKDLCSYTIMKPGTTCEVEVLFQPRPLPKKEKEGPRLLEKEGLLVIPFSKLPDLEKALKVTVPLKGTALFKGKEKD